MESNIVGQMIKTKRKERNLTQEQLAKMINSNVYYISRIETGKKLPSNKFLISLSNALDTPIDFFLGLESNFMCSAQLSDLEKKLLNLSINDRELILSVLNTLIERFSDD